MLQKSGFISSTDSVTYSPVKISVLNSPQDAQLFYTKIKQHGNGSTVYVNAFMNGEIKELFKVNVADGRIERPFLKWTSDYLYLYIPRQVSSSRLKIT
jgi:hypothetical protein